MPGVRPDPAAVGQRAQGGPAVFAGAHARLPVPVVVASEAARQAAVSAVVPVAAVEARPEQVPGHPPGEARSATEAAVPADAGRPAGVVGTSRSSKLRS